jgi:amino acid permease
LFSTVGICGYLYGYTGTKDNILLNFPLSVKSILLGRIGYGITIMFGMPLVFLPCRAALLSIPEQIQEWRDVVHHRRSITSIMRGTKHHVANGVTFDEECPLVMEHVRKSVSWRDEIDSDTAGSTQSSRGHHPHYGAAAPATDDSFLGDLRFYSNYDMSVRELDPVDPAIHQVQEDERIRHVLSTATILVAGYITAVGVPGVAIVWRIAGSSMAIMIGFFIPAACYLKIRSKKSINPRSISAVLLLLFSIVASFVCTTRTIRDL